MPGACAVWCQGPALLPSEYSFCLQLISERREPDPASSSLLFPRMRCAATTTIQTNNLWPFVVPGRMRKAKLRLLCWLWSRCVVHLASQHCPGFLRQSATSSLLPQIPLHILISINGVFDGCITHFKIHCPCPRKNGALRNTLISVSNYLPSRRPSTKPRACVQGPGSPFCLVEGAPVFMTYQ